MQKQTHKNRLRELRNEKCLKLYEVSTVVKADPSTVHRWETGQSAVPDTAKFALAELYGVTISHLMGWDEELAA